MAKRNRYKFIGCIQDLLDIGFVKSGNELARYKNGKWLVVKGREVLTLRTIYQVAELEPEIVSDLIELNLVEVVRG